ncbi:hypothetical protein FWH58_01935 [Candidatus Saccharibacteria bacterium]|nr:hypothetical protein [Candidatus Saccharibacteria bacterium]
MKSSKKPDEMEKAISYQAIQITWRIVHVAFIVTLVLAAALFIWGALQNNGFGIAGMMDEGSPVRTLDEITSTLLVFIIVLELIHYIIKRVLRYNLTKGGREK